MKTSKKSTSSLKRYPPSSFMHKLRKRRIIETLAAFAGAGVVIIELAHHILVNHYHFPHQTVDVCIVTLTGALICTLTWRWFKGIKTMKRIKIEIILIPLVILAAAVLDIRLFMQMGGQDEEAVIETKWKNSIAVLPFVNRTGDEEQEILCEGLTEELINRLTNIKVLKVPASTSVFAFKGEKIIIQDVGEKLKVEKVLEGSVRKSGDQLRISVQLINVADGFHIWSEQYAMQLDDFFDIQDKISIKVIEKLQLDIKAEERIRLTKKSTSDIDAFKFYMKGKFLRYHEKPKEMLMAKDYLEEAIRKDPEYAPAYAGLAENYMVLGLYSVIPRSQASFKAREAAQKALKLDKDLSEAHVSIGVIKMVFDWDWEGAEEELKLAIGLNPNNFDAHREYGLLLFRTYRYVEAEKEFFKSLELDPLNFLPLRDLRWLYLIRGMDEKAEEFNIKLKEIEPDMSDFWKDDYYNIERVNRIIHENGRYPIYIGDLAISFIKSKELNPALKLIEELESIYQVGLEGNVALHLALIFNEMKEGEIALSWLERAVEKKAPGLINLSIYLPFVTLQGEARFQSCLEKIGLN